MALAASLTSPSTEEQCGFGLYPHQGDSTLYFQTGPGGDVFGPAPPGATKVEFRCDGMATPVTLRTHPLPAWALSGRWFYGQSVTLTPRCYVTFRNQSGDQIQPVSFQSTS